MLREEKRDWKLYWRAREAVYRWLCRWETSFFGNHVHPRHKTLLVLRNAGIQTYMHAVVRSSGGLTAHWTQNWWFPGCSSPANLLAGTLTKYMHAHTSFKTFQRGRLHEKRGGGSYVKSVYSKRTELFLVRHATIMTSVCLSVCTLVDLIT